MTAHLVKLARCQRRTVAERKAALLQAELNLADTLARLTDALNPSLPASQDPWEVS